MSKKINPNDVQKEKREGETLVVLAERAGDCFLKSTENPMPLTFDVYECNDGDTEINIVASTMADAIAQFQAIQGVEPDWCRMIAEDVYVNRPTAEHILKSLLEADN